MMIFSQVESPGTQAELVAVLGKTTPQTRYICGGTDIIQTIRQTHVQGDLLISLDRVTEMCRISRSNGHITVGAALPFADVAAAGILPPGAGCLVQAASQMGSPQIRNRATIGGNIANASACADAIAPLLVLDALVIVIDDTGKKQTRHIHDIITGVETNSLAHNEVIFGVVFPVPSPCFRSAFEKLGAKTTVTISKINMAVGCDINPTTHTLSDVRVALGAVGTVARRFPGAETILEGAVYSQKTADAFAAQVSRDVEDVIRDRSSMPYKRQAVQGVALDVLARCIAHPCSALS
jgi:xanthine dehydrogenase FAD-binding subunit